MFAALQPAAPMAGIWKALDSTFQKPRAASTDCLLIESGRAQSVGYAIFPISPYPMFGPEQQDLAVGRGNIPHNNSRSV